MAVASVEIPLTRGQVATIDVEDYERVVNEGRWFASWSGWGWYAGRNVRRADGSRGTIRLHTFLTGGMQVDHINGDGLDNRRGNLRDATTAQNGRNRGAQVNNTSGFKGVTWDKTDRLWRAQIHMHKAHRSLGRYATAEEAARAYDRAASEQFGEFAHLNFPGEVATWQQSA